jgi:hypothetical protein
MNMSSQMNAQLSSEGIPTIPGQAMGIRGQAPMGAAPEGGSSAPVSNAQVQSTLQNYGK